MDNQMVNKSVNIKEALKEAGVSQSDLAEMLHVSPVAVHYVVSGKKSIPRIRAAVAMAIGRKVNDLWSDSRK